ncbi:XrtA/PEP-CTERM system TPR-repeat protein PrsT [Sediminicurvatus halobius]|uniref:PEP-CTERM system TPR-repeat protein PrsT n=1 Tax=Sediminicurvatus halobius TaxID=2182432 RepID=A0A2U2N0D7_9GAMM|nr:XrtA/PEP-CTERM system TPR-repeat protein PrsT [Spiribacter halobius]PWG62701.1 PEP-CTERM system TPR-repeat protein PrsT [Spiribacter halobius]UEX77370.1 PEP-CTERM system TPR-repeat protein PrsT [Spiribacter halobius]
MDTGFRHRLAPFVVLVALTLITACSEPRANAPELLDQAKQHMADGETREAHITLLNALQADSSLTEARHLLARTSLALGDFARAEKEIRRAMEDGVPGEKGLPILVRALVRQGKDDAALDETDELPDGLGDAVRAEILGLRGQAALNLRDVPAAETSFQDALELDSDAPDARVGMAMMAGLQRNAEEARDWLEPLLDREPALADAWSTLGDLELQTENLEAAIDAFSTAIDARPYPTLDRAKRALAYILTDNEAAGREDLSTIRSEGFGNHPYVGYVRGVAEFRAENFDDALAALQQSAEDAPDFLPTQIYLAATHHRLGNSEQALRAARTVYRAAPQSLLGASLLTGIHLSRSELAAAETILRDALAENPDVPALLGTVSNIALLRGDTSEALTFAERLMSQRPDSAAARNLALMARLLDGAPLDDSLLESVRTDGDEQSLYVADFLAASAAFRDGRMEDAMRQATRLRERYPDRADPMKLLAAVQLRNGQWPAARESLNEALELAPEDVGLLSSLAKVERALGNAERAGALAKDALELDPGNGEMALFVSDVAAARGNRDEARAVLENTLATAPESLQVRRRLAADYFADRQLDKVLDVTADLSSGEERDAPELLELRGQAFLLAGDPSAAQPVFARLTELRPESARAHFLHAETLARTGRLDRSRAELRRALELDPDLVEARIGQVRLLVRDGQMDEARRRLDELASRFGDRPEVTALQGWFALGTGDYADAEAYSSQALEDAPTTDVFITLVQALWAQGKHDAAISRMSAWLEENPTDATVLMHLAGAYLSLDQPAKARETYDRVVTHHPDHVAALNNLAWLSREVAPKRALELARRAYELVPQDPEILDTLGELLLRDGQLDAAHRRLSEARELAPDDRGIQMNLARVLMAQGREAEAETLLQMVVDGETEDDETGREARQLLATLRGSD